MLGRKGSGLMALPFLRLQADGFWKPVANSGYDSNVDYNVTSMVNLKQIYAICNNKTEFGSAHV